MKTILIFFTLIFSNFQNLGAEIIDDKTVLLAILARDKEHFLPYYLKCVDKLDYEKHLITVYINTNNNTDNTEEILRDWAEQHKESYKKIIFESHSVKNFKSVNPHEWTPDMFKILGNIRNKSLQKALDNKCDFYFVVDCDNFILPCTLKTLISKDKPIVAPMLKSVPNPADPYSNFFCDVSPTGYYKSHPNYFKILNKKMKGTFKVPVVHCTYLVKSTYINKLGYIDNTNDYEFVIFSRKARENNIEQYICNENDFGTLIHLDEQSVSLDDEKAIIEQL